MLTVSRLKKILHYDPQTGIFRWKKKTCKKVVVGKVAGTLNEGGYIAITIGGMPMRAHRLAWLYVNGVYPSKIIDHIDRNKTNNRIKNLRDVSQRVNQYNRSRQFGVTRDKRCVTKPWRARIMVKGKQVNLGYFASKLPALSAREAAEAKAMYDALAA